MIRIPALYDTVILTRPQTTLDARGWPVEVPALTRCKVIDVCWYAASSFGLRFELDPLDVGDLEPFQVGEACLVDGCHPFVIFPPNAAQDSYWASRVVDAVRSRIMPLPNAGAA
jgi:hypothetical protein